MFPATEEAATKETEIRKIVENALAAIESETSDRMVQLDAASQIVGVLLYMTSSPPEYAQLIAERTIKRIIEVEAATDPDFRVGVAKGAVLGF